MVKGRTLVAAMPKVKIPLSLKDAVRQPKFGGTYRHRILLGTPTMGTVRIEWHNCLSGLVIPTNWGNSTMTPIGFRVDDAQNVIVKQALEQNFEWVIFLEDDVCPPSDLFIKFNEYLEKPKVPIVSGLYFLKATRPEPLIYRGRGNGAFKDFKMGQKVWADGVPTGCLLVHTSILKVLAETAETYTLRSNESLIQLKRVFWTPRMVFSDPALLTYQKLLGTSDLWFCDQIIKEKVLQRAGWKQIAKRQYPFLVDTSLYCLHIDRGTSQMFGAPN